MPRLNRHSMPDAGECSNNSLQLYRLFEQNLGAWKNFARRANGSISSNKAFLKPATDVLRVTAEARRTAGRAVWCQSLALSWRFLIGLSYGRLHNNSFGLHPLLGVPYIPGAALKGAIRSAMSEEGAPAPDLERWFGSQDSAGSAEFFDAFAASFEHVFAPDTITPHNLPYYGGQAHPPADDTDPIPIEMLSVRPGVKFEFLITSTEEDRPFLERCEECLMTYGVGAKTRRGYGIFRPADVPGHE